MPLAEVEPGVKLYYESKGKGSPVVFVHEFAGSHRSWDPQVDVLGRSFRIVVYNCRGYPPSTVPADVQRYSQDRSTSDLCRLLDLLQFDRINLVGLSMGGSIALNFCLQHPQRVMRLVVAATGSGANRREDFVRNFEAIARRLEEEGTRPVADDYLTGPTRIQLKRKSPKAWRKLYEEFCALSPQGLANTIRGTILPRPSVYMLEPRLRQLQVPTLIIVGEEDSPTLAPCRFMAATIPGAHLLVLERTGHTVNLEEPEHFNGAVSGFLAR